MAEYTKRGEEEQKRAEEAVGGEPVADRPADAATLPGTQTTRDRGVEPTADARRDGRGENRRDDSAEKR